MRELIIPDKVRNLNHDIEGLTNRDLDIIAILVICYLVQKVYVELHYESSTLISYIYLI